MLIKKVEQQLSDDVIANIIASIITQRFSSTQEINLDVANTKNARTFKKPKKKYKLVTRSERIKQMRESGSTVREICKKLSISPATMYKTMKTSHLDNIKLKGMK